MACLERLERLGPAGVLLASAVAPLPAGIGAFLYAVHGERAWLPPELAGGAADVGVLSTRGPRVVLPILGWELLLLGGLAATGILAGSMGARWLLTDRARSITRSGRRAGILGVVAAVGTKGCVAYAAWRPSARPWVDVADLAAQGFAFALALLLSFSVLVAAGVTGTLAFRAVCGLTGRWRTVDPAQVECGCGPSTKDSATGSAAWALNWRLPSTRKLCEVGICVSGGGIRSAAFSLGALQVLQETGELSKADCLVAVSGGAYTVGAMRLALAKAPPGQQWSSVASPEDVFSNGSPEFDHVRRHSKYLAEGLGQWLVALGAVLRGFVVAQIMLLCTVILAGRAIGEVYKAIPALSEPFRHLSDSPPDYGLRFPPSAIVDAIAGTFAVSAVVWLVAVMMENSSWWSEPLYPVRIRRAANSLALLGLAMVVVAVLVPLLVRLSGDLLRTVPVQHAAGPGTSKAEATAKTTAAGAATVAATGYLAVMAGIFMTVGRLTRPAAGWVWSHRSNLRALPTVVLQWLLVVLGVAVLVVAHVFVFARIVADTLSSTWSLRDGWPGAGRNWYFLVVLLVLVVLGGLADQTRWSLHPFYRRRLMTAFTVRRARGDAGLVQPRPYDFDAETTRLSEYCKDTTGFPRVVFLAAANVSGQDLTPPGRRAVPYTLSGDWIGSPRLGWVRTEALERAAPYPIRLDLTTQAAMAVSGAAFASAMGAAAAPFSLLFTLTNARLGTWLPNPRFLCRRPPDGTSTRPLPGLPRWRRLSYLIREIFGVYPSDGQMLLVTDGGHYENLGLVELLRHAPAKAYCFDASGGDSLAASAFGPAITLAYEELGVKITFRPTVPTVACNAPECLAPGSADDDPAAAGLKGRLARSAVLVADIEYPDCAPGRPGGKGTLYFGRAILTPDSPWAARAYASTHPTYPNDKTSDQWFNQAQFDAYHLLGRHVGCLTAPAAGVPCGSDRLATTSQQATVPATRRSPEPPLAEDLTRASR